jgi:hypothetical protein
VMTMALWSMRFRNTSSKRSDRHCDRERRTAVTRNCDNAKRFEYSMLARSVVQNRARILYVGQRISASALVRTLRRPRLPGGMKLHHRWEYIGHHD